MEARAREVVWNACREQSLRCLLVVLAQSYVEVGVCFVVSFLFFAWLLRPAAEEGPEPRRANGECARPRPQERRPVTESSDVLERGGRRSWRTASHADLMGPTQAAASHRARSWTPAVAGRGSGHGGAAVQHERAATAGTSRTATVRTEKELGGRSEALELRPPPFPRSIPSTAPARKSGKRASERASSGARFYSHIVHQQRLEAASELRAHAKASDMPNFSRSQRPAATDTSARKGVRFACLESALVLPNPFSFDAVNHHI